MNCCRNNVGHKWLHPPIAKTVGQPHPLAAFLIAGAAIGLLGVGLFGAVHAVIIVPIWTRLLGGVPFGLVAGTAIGWALHELRASRRWGRGIVAALAFGLVLWLTLLPMTLFGVMLRAAGMHGTDDFWEVGVESLLAFGAGATAGRLIARRWRAALALGAASLALTFAQAGPIPVLNSARAAWLFAALAVIYLPCGLAIAFVASAVSRAGLTPHARDGAGESRGSAGTG
jgi:hypothetical protein